MNQRGDKILFFDGVCGLCNSTVNQVMKADKKQLILFAPLQGETARKLLPEHLRGELSSFVFLDKDRIHLKSTGVLEVCRYLPSYRWIRAFKIVPSAIRDWVYNFVAKNRYRWFGKQDHCRLPLPNERALFLP